MVLEIQAPSRRNGFLVSSPFQETKSSIARQLLPSLGVCTGSYTYQRATAIVRRQNPINHPRRTIAVVEF